MKKQNKATSVLLGLAALVCVGLCALLLPWLATRVGADTGSKAAGSKSAAEVVTAYEMDVNNLISSALSELEELPVVIPKKVYVLSEDTVIAPKPDPARFGSSSDPADTVPVMEAAAELMGEERFLWDPSTETLSGSTVRWYLDDTICSISWKELVNSRSVYSFTEVKVAHPSQFRRYLADNTFANPIQYLPTELAKTVNAVTAMNGDFYKHRKIGTVVYNRTLYRLDSQYLDTCFIDTAGDLNFVRSGALPTEEAVNQYVAENDILFSLAFGPVLIEEGVDVCPAGYLIGEVTAAYSRAAICQLGPCHYLLVTVNHDSGYSGVATIRTLTDHLMQKGVPNAYCLDGGQTSTMIVGGELFNRPDWGAERAVSDIIYFATAIPESEWNGGEEG